MGHLRISLSGWAFGNPQEYRFGTVRERFYQEVFLSFYGYRLLAWLGSSRRRVVGFSS